VSDDFDARLRREAQAWLTVRTHDGQVPLTSDELMDFAIDGRPFKLMDRQRGIRKPRELAAALSIRTVYTVEGGARPYEDAVGSDGLLRYKWRGDDPNHAENRALREAMLRELPLIWFCGVGQGIYRPVFPIYLLWEEREQQQFVLDPDIAQGLVDRETPVTEHLRRYIRADGCTSPSSGRRCSGPTTRAALCVRCDITSCLTRPTSSRTVRRPGSPPCATAWLSAKSTTPPTTAMSWGSGPITSSRSALTCWPRSTDRCWSTG
jgi:hypothetical protein